MKELEMLAEAMAEDTAPEEEAPATVTLDDLVAQLQNVAVQMAEAVGAMKAAAEATAEVVTPDEPIDESTEEDDDCE